ncbi:GNAT family N-acetyltransferase [Vibrio hepatarius]|uniref:GNAT family N-acetyltransferase n=1 Tax=Vibrio hepatarius TaxID=171383 RepID=UPI00148D97EA|nr:GNAT family N-acetyltransferase [Vibrio hepatarius]NOI13843.1 GNAT family N-acetyltransferase [Vibrio hepatarius]
MPIIESSNLFMRSINEGDWPLFERLHEDEEVIRYAFDKPSTEQIRSRFESRLPKWEWGSTHWLCLVIIHRDTKQPMGVMGLCRSEEQQEYVEVGYLLLPEYHGKGFGTESLLALVEYAKANFPIEKFNAIVTDGNIASCKVLEKVGFVLREREPNAYQIGGVDYDDLIYSFEV